ncbi:hypothetical protein HYPGJ_30781 [Hyphomicrobium sp. GJ21]|nr:hypothetical protein HYPGJ_30781 [Hyphomicrobium sp. GJ21]
MWTGFGLFYAIPNLLWDEMWVGEMAHHVQQVTSENRTFARLERPDSRIRPSEKSARSLWRR